MNITLKNLTSGLAAMLLAWPAWPAWAGGDGSDGHTHAAQTPVMTAPVSTASPRLSSQTDQFELVGVLQGKVLTLYLDQFGTNAPIAKAQIELESGAWKDTATEVSPAVYTVSADPLAQVGQHPLVITVQAGEATDLMDATLEVGSVRQAATGVSHTHLWGEWTVWWGAAALSAAAAALMVIRRQRRQSNRKHAPQ